MKLLKRNLTSFDYRACLGQQEVIVEEERGNERVQRHTGRYAVKYADPVAMEGSIATARGFVANEWYGIDTRYTHVLVMDNPNADIKEDGLIDWRGDTYEVRAVRPSLNVLSVALRKLPKSETPGA